MAFQGYSNLQRQQIEALQAGLTGVNSDLQNHKSAYALKVSALDQEDVRIDGRIDAHILAYNAKMTLLDAQDDTHNGLITGNKSIADAQHGVALAGLTGVQANLTTHIGIYDANKIATDVATALVQTNLDNHIDNYDAEVAHIWEGMTGVQTNLTNYITSNNTRADGIDADIDTLDGRADVLDGRATAVEGRADALEDLVWGATGINGLTGRVTVLEGKVEHIESEIGAIVTDYVNNQVAVGTYAQLAAELANTDSALSLSLAEKVSRVLQRDIDTAQWNALYSGLTGAKNYTDARFDALNAALSASNDSSTEGVRAEAEARFMAIEEYIRVMSMTYTIDLPAGGVYAYKGEIQDIAGVAPALVSVASKRTLSATSWGLVLQLSEYSYNSLLGKVVAEVPGVTGGVELVKADFNSGSYQYVLAIPNSRSGSTYTATLPFNIKYLGIQGDVLHTEVVSATAFAAYANSSPVYPLSITGATGVQGNDITFKVNNTTGTSYTASIYKNGVAVGSSFSATANAEVTVSFASSLVTANDQVYVGATTGGAQLADYFTVPALDAAPAPSYLATITGKIPDNNGIVFDHVANIASTTNLVYYRVVNANTLTPYSNYDVFTGYSRTGVNASVASAGRVPGTQLVIQAYDNNVANPTIISAPFTW